MEYFFNFNKLGYLKAEKPQTAFFAPSPRVPRKWTG